LFNTFPARTGEQFIREPIVGKIVTVATLIPQTSSPAITPITSDCRTNDGSGAGI
jgi:hypothetical protein